MTLPKPLFVTVAFCLFLAPAATHAPAATYIVDAAAPNAADANPGSEDKPFKTVQHAADRVRAGDTVCVMEGTYAERVTLKNGGVQGEVITFRACSRRTVKILGFSTGSAAYVRIEGFDITAPKSRTPGIEIGSDHVEVVDNYLHDLGLAVGPAAGGPTPPANAEVAYNDVYQCQEGIWTGGNGSALLPEVIQGVRFIDGIKAIAA